MKGIAGKISPPLRLAILSMVVCGLVFPGVVTGIGQVVFPYQANGSQAYYGNQSVGSYLLSQEFNSSAFFHARNDSASGLDPDITVPCALTQAYRIHNATGIAMQSLNATIQHFSQYTYFFFGNKYVNVLKLNMYLVKEYPSLYASLV